jgi:hypothetical protein
MLPRSGISIPDAPQADGTVFGLGARELNGLVGRNTLSTIRFVSLDHSVAHPPFHPRDKQDSLRMELGKQGEIHVFPYPSR